MRLYEEGVQKVRLKRLLAAAVVSPGGGWKEGLSRVYEDKHAKRAASVGVLLMHCWPSRRSSAGMLVMYRPSDSPAACMNTSWRRRGCSRAVSQCCPSQDPVFTYAPPNRPTCSC